MLLELLYKKIGLDVYGNYLNTLFSQGITVSEVVLITLIILTCIAFIWAFYIPCNWTKSIDDVGYSTIKCNGKNHSGLEKKDAINRLRKMRQIGSKDMPPPYPNGWYGILESSKLALGESMSMSCLGEQLVVYRTQKGKVFVLNAYCPHLGANLGIGGKVVGNNIVCPFHNWSFRGSDGACTNVPYSNCVPQGSKVKKWISKEMNDFIFIWYHVEPDEEPWELPVVPQIENKELVFHGRNEFYVNCHIQEIPENGADLAHFTAIHSESIFAGGENPKKSILANAGNHNWQAIWKASDEDQKHLATVTLQHYLEITPKFHCFQLNVIGQQIGPAYVQLHIDSPLLGRLEILQTITPIEPLVQKVVHRFYAKRIWAPLMKIAIFGESVMFERDMKVWNHKMFRNNPQLVKEDAALRLFRNWFSQFYTSNSKTFSEARSSIDW